MADKKQYLGKNALLYVLNKLKDIFVKKEEGKGLSTKDFTTEYEEKIKKYADPSEGQEGQVLMSNGNGSTKWADNESGQTYDKASADADGLMSKEDFTKLQNIEEGAQVNKIEKIKVNGEEQSIQTKEIDITVPKDTNDLTNGKEYQTKTEVEALINNKISSAVHYKGDVETYDELPPNAQNGDLYNIKTASEHNKAGDNAVWNETNEAWDILSGTIDTSLFITDNDLEEISNAEIDELFNS